MSPRRAALGPAEVDEFGVTGVEILEHAAALETELRQQRLHRGVGEVSRGPELLARVRYADAVLHQCAADARPARMLGDHQHLDKGRTEETAGQRDVADRCA